MRLQPKPKTIKALFAKSGNQCAFPGCTHPIVDDDDLFVGEVCHIFPVGKYEARFDSRRKPEELRRVENLILLCHQHHVKIDSSEKEFPPSLLIRMKANHQRSVNTRIYEPTDSIVEAALFQIIHNSWEPEFEDIIDYLVEDAEEYRGGQQGVNGLLIKVGKLLDAKLQILYLKIVSVSESGKRKRFCENHRRWEIERARRSHLSGRDCRGGSMEPFLFSCTYNEMTKKRIEALKKRLIQL